LDAALKGGATFRLSDEILLDRGAAVLRPYKIMRHRAYDCTQVAER